MDPNCIFCKIVAGQIPCHKLYEDDRVLAFLDLGPLSEGHALVIPKHHTANLADLPDDDAAAVGRVLPRLAKAISQAVQCPSYNVLVNFGEPAGQVVMHVHFHIIPKPTDAPRSGGQPGSGLGLHWPASKLDADRAKELTDKVTQILNR
ncbi:MAG: hypothetical protein Kow00105_03760 [Phycisphaeraceae bacterium]